MNMKRESAVVRKLEIIGEASDEGEW